MYTRRGLTWVWASILPSVVFACLPQPNQDALPALVVGGSHIPALLAPLSIMRTPEERVLTSMLFDPLYGPDQGTPRALQNTENAGEGDRLPEPCDRCILAVDDPVPVGTSSRQWDIPLKQNVPWHDGRLFSSADVAYSWQVLISPQNEYPDREMLGSLVRSVRAAGPNSVRVVFNVDMYPQQLQDLLDFPIMPASVRGQAAPRTIHPDSASGNPRLREYLGRPIGTGPFWIPRALHESSGFLPVSRFGGSGAILRVLPGDDGLETAVRHDELHVVLNADDSLARRWSRGYRRVEGDMLVSVALAFTPTDPRLSSPDRRRLVGTMIGSAVRDLERLGVCEDGGRFLPVDTLRISTYQSGPLISQGIEALRDATACLGAHLIVASARRGLVHLGEGILLRLGDRPTDVSALLEHTRNVLTGDPALEPADRVYEQWLRTPGREDRAVLSAELLTTMRDLGVLVTLRSQTTSMLIASGVEGIRLSEYGLLVGSRTWRWR